MRIVYPKEINDLHDTIPDQYLNNIEDAPQKYKEQFELWKEKKHAYDRELRKDLFGF